VRASPPLNKMSYKF